MESKKSSQMEMKNDKLNTSSGNEASGGNLSKKSDEKVKLDVDRVAGTDQIDGKSFKSDDGISMNEEYLRIMKK